MSDSPIIYTYTDEAPALATRSLLPVVEAFARVAGVPVETRDISLAARILAQFPERLGDKAVSDDLAELGEIAKRPEANIIKLPNISASVPQMKACVAELREKGYDLPDLPDEPETDEQRDVAARYDVAKGSAVNPVLREGNSDRRAPAPVKAAARKKPHSMGEWSPDSKAHVATMGAGDFRSHEKSVTLADAGELRVELVGDDGSTTVLKESIPVQAGEVVDSTFMSAKALRGFLEQQVAETAATGDVLFGMHLKATMMKVSDPIIFGHGVRAYLADVWAEHGDYLEGTLELDPADGLASVLAGLESSDDERAGGVLEAIRARLADGPPLAYVDSGRGITNLHVPSDTIVDASMPAMIRTSGKMWGADDDTHDGKAVIPDSSYAALYAETIEDCKARGAFDPTTMGTVQNVGLMAKKAEEYGSHDKTFEVGRPGTVRLVDASSREVLTEHPVEAGDIWRACQTKDAPVRDWVSLAVRRARATAWPAVFWLDATRAHDRQLLTKVKEYLAEEGVELDAQNRATGDVHVEVLDVAAATRFTLDRVRRGEDTISVTGNVLRDYLTDLFPILELGTSAKMLSIVPLMNGGGLFETGAGGSAPKHVQQLEKENHLRWDSLGEFLALAQSFAHYGEFADNPRAALLGRTLDQATEKLLDQGKSPSRKVGEIDNRGSHAYLAQFWARALADQDEDAALADAFRPVAESLETKQKQIDDEMVEVQGDPVDLGGYYLLDDAKADAVMRPSPTLNEVVDGLGR